MKISIADKKPYKTRATCILMWLEDIDGMNKIVAAVQ